jgi:hypothetical protein
MDYTNGCLECGDVQSRVIRGYCQSCWPQIRRDNKAYKEGRESVRTGAHNPYNLETDYKTYMAWEMGWSDAQEKEDKQL